MIEGHHFSLSSLTLSGLIYTLNFDLFNPSTQTHKNTQAHTHTLAIGIQLLFPLFAFRDLFNAAFVSCWAELPEQQQDELVRCLEQALRPQNIPEITQTILNLAEFMEHCDKVLSMAISLTHHDLMFCLGSSATEQQAAR